MAKKTKNFETPIDQRETFVSIQKTFADSDLTVAEKLKTLYVLQQADTEIDKILQLRGELPVEVENLENEIADLNLKVARISEHVEEMTKYIAENKLSITECDAQIEKYKAQLENISNSREYDSLNKEIENQGLLRQIAEKHIGEAKERILDKKQELEIVKEKIDARTMSAYERIRMSCNNHLAVVSVFNGDSCGGCFNTIAPQRLIDIASNRKMIICEHCGRILVNPDFE